MTQVVIDASVVLKWFRREGERHGDEARHLRGQYEAGALNVIAPPLLMLELVSVAGRRWNLDEKALVTMAASLVDLGFELVEPDLQRVASWTAAGLTAYDAAYVTVAESAGVPLITDDDAILAVAPAVAQPLA
ncbi:MAG: type II toxin-antitoxin system VapC family toxin [Gaiellales bacterium]